MLAPIYHLTNVLAPIYHLTNVLYQAGMSLLLDFFFFILEISTAGIQEASR